MEKKGGLEEDFPLQIGDFVRDQSVIFPNIQPPDFSSFFQGETWTVKVGTLKVVEKSWGTGNEMTALLFGTMVLMVG